MTNLSLENRVDFLEFKSKEHESRLTQIENLLMQTVYLQQKNEINIARLHDEIKNLNNEMKDFKDEMLDFKNEMKDFKDEMLVFKNEMQKFREEAERDRKEMNKKWGALAQKMGTLVEDIVAPGISEAVKNTFGLEVEDLIVRRRKKLKDGRVREYDIIAIADNYAMVVDVKSSYKTKDFDIFKKALEEFQEYFPEFQELTLVGIIASLYLTNEIVNTATNLGILAINMSGDYLEFMNADQVNIIKAH